MEIGGIKMKKNNKIIIGSVLTFCIFMLPTISVIAIAESDNRNIIPNSTPTPKLIVGKIWGLKIETEGYTTFFTFGAPIIWYRGLHQFCYMKINEDAFTGTIAEGRIFGILSGPPVEFRYVY